MKTIKNIIFSEGEMLFDMDIETAKKYKLLSEVDLENSEFNGDRRTANVVKRIIKNIDLYITKLNNPQ